MKATTITLCAVVCSVVATSCGGSADAPPGEPVASKQMGVTLVDGDAKTHLLGFLQHVIGRGLNGTDIDGTSFEDTHVAFAELDSATYEGEPMSSIDLEAGEFEGRTALGKRISKARFTDVEFSAVTDTGSTVQLRIRSAERVALRGLQQVFLYDVGYRTSEGWASLCGVDEAGDPLRAMALPGYWDHREGVEGGGDKIDDPTRFTLACEGHVAAKCVEMGYMPWREAMVCGVGEGCSRESIGYLHQACTRMMRGDYCGDGSAHTVENTSINVYDGYGIRDDADAWDMEAEWTTEGARCLVHPRIVEDDPLPCAPQLVQPSCGDAASFTEGAMLITEVPPI